MANNKCHNSCPSPPLENGAGAELGLFLFGSPSATGAKSSPPPVLSWGWMDEPV